MSHDQESDPTLHVSQPEEIVVTNEQFKNILKHNGIEDEISDVEWKDAGLQGEGFGSTTYCVTAKFQNLALKPLNLFVKTETSNPSHSEVLKEAKLFSKESTFFMNYIPKAKELCESKGLPQLMEIYPKCYYGDTKMTVFENLVLDKGYALLDKIDQQDFETACLAMTTLATHHAISFAMIREVGGAAEFFKLFPHLGFEAFAASSFKNMMGSSIFGGINTIIQVLEKSNAKNKEEAIALFKEKSGKSWDEILNALKNSEHEDFLVLNHGDYWNNNMMFSRNKESNKLEKHIAIDFQLTRYGSPGLDLSYYLYSSVKPEVRKDKLEDLLKHYLEVLLETSDKLGYPANLSYEKLYHLYCKKVSYGIWFMGVFTVCSACYIVAKEMDVTKIDMNDWANECNDLVQKWIKENPTACERDAELMVALAMDYKNLYLENI